MTMSHVTHAACAAPQIIQGYSMLTTVISSAVSALVGAGLGWYIRGRGMTGVQIDINNAKAEIEKIKTQLSAQTAQLTPTPVA